jgi:PAS domain-containing protein
VHCRAAAAAVKYDEPQSVVLSRAEYELLLLKESAMDAVKEGITIADCRQPDMPLIYCNAGFSRITGYSAAEVLGKNCRFLQVGFNIHIAALP